MLQTTSTLAFKFKDGIIVAADTSVTYGSLAATKLNRIFCINNTLITFNGFVGDFLQVKKDLEQEIANDKSPIDAKGIFKFLQLVLYGARSKTEPKFCSIVVAGIGKANTNLGESGNPNMFLGTINSKGVFWEDTSVATGFASHFALPLFRATNLEEMN
ncbi:PSB7 [Enterospora canceri]|uniref:PSB7 n=1 Tax=Enterospora canceri TaxID=1081671 RepID=A0A1Y1S5M6_9MICR|nr:PSB7 [Enterospora canceri]